MKHKIIKLFLLFLTVSVLSSSRENEGVNKKNKLLRNEHGCLHIMNDYAVNLTCKKIPAVEENMEEALIAPAGDYELPLSPISRFILVQ